MKEDIKVGDVVICVNTGFIDGVVVNYNPPLLKLNAEYIVHGINICPCGLTAFDIGVVSDSGRIRCKCGRETFNEPIRWCDERRFVKKDTRSIEEQIAEAVEVENYELAEKLKNQKL